MLNRMRRTKPDRPDSRGASVGGSDWLVQLQDGALFLLGRLRRLQRGQDRLVEHVLQPFLRIGDAAGGYR